MREIVSSPCTTCEFIALATATCSPVFKSIKLPTTVVVPISRANPNIRLEVSPGSMPISFPLSNIPVTMNLLRRSISEISLTMYMSTSAPPPRFSQSGCGFSNVGSGSLSNALRTGGANFTLPLLPSVKNFCPWSLTSSGIRIFISLLIVVMQASL